MNINHGNGVTPGSPMIFRIFRVFPTVFGGVPEASALRKYHKLVRISDVSVSPTLYSFTVGFEEARGFLAPLS